MNLTKNLIVSIQALPKKLVRDGLMVCEYGPEPGCVVAIHNELPAHCYYPSLKKWKRIKIDEKPAIIRPITGVETIGRRCVILTPKAIHATKP